MHNNKVVNLELIQVAETVDSDCTIHSITIIIINTKDR